MKKAAVVLTLTLLVFSLASAASLDPRHPLSHIHPTDTDFNMSGYQVFNASSFELQDGLNLSGYSVYDQGGVEILGWDENNGKWDFTNSDIEMVDGNIQMNGNNITEIDTLHFLTGMKINGSINMSGGDIDLDNGSIRNVYSIDGGGDAVNFFDSIDFNGNSIKDSDGSLTVDTRVYVPNNDIDMAGNNIINPGKVDGIDLDFPGNGLGITNSRYNIITDAIGDNELNNSQEFTMQGLDVSGGNITNIDTLKFEEGTSIDGNITINGSINTTGGIDLNDEDIDDVRSIDGGGDSVRFDDSIDLNNNNLIEPNQIQTGGQNIQIRDTTNGQDVARFQEGGNVVVPSGNLNINTDFANYEIGGERKLSGASGGETILYARGTNGSEDIRLYDDSNGLSILRAYVGGNVAIPNGNLQIGDGQALINRDFSSGTDAVQVLQRSGSGQWFFKIDSSSDDLEIQSNSQNSGGTLQLTQTQDVEIPNGNLFLNGNSIVDNQGTLTLDGGNVGIPNGNLNVNNQLSVGSTECPTGSYIDGDGSCTDVTSETQGEYVDEAGDTMTGNLDMNYNQIGNVSELNVSTSTDQIAHFSDTGVTLSQPLSVESSGPLSVANGIDLTGSSSNTIDSYSTMYLQTSSGSPSDIVLDPTGEVGIDANTSIVGNLDLQGGTLQNADLEAGSVDEDEINQNTLDDSEIQSGGIGTDSIASNSVTNTELANSNSFTVNGLTTNANVNMNEYEIQNVDGIQDGSGTNTINFDGSNNVGIPNGNLDVSGGSLSVDTSGTGDNSPLHLTGDVHSINTLEASSGNEITWNFDQTNGGGWKIGMDNRPSGRDDEFTIKNSTQNNDEPFFAIDHSGNVEIPNGNLNVNNQLTVGSTECNTGQYIDGDGTCTSVTGETSGEYVDESGDNMTGQLNMNSNPVVNVGTNNIDIGDGQGNIAMNGQRIVDGGLTQVSGLGVTGSLSTAETEVSGNSIYVQNDVSVDGDFVGAGADVAEKIQNESSMESGTVVKISGNMSVDKTSETRDKAVAGVVSRDPAMIMAKERDGVPIAMSGTIPVKFSDENGGVEPGDFLTTASKKGYAMKCDDIVKCQGSIIGKAMQPQKETGEVEMLISRG